jgi:two-component system osmolarity sensor histidine kinase EnvZ
MLAGVSHDLRTPLTRMKLELALLGDRPEAREMNRDVAEMERMIDGFLAFARGQDTEPPIEADVAEILRQVVRDTERQHHGRAVLETESPLLCTVRPNALRRCITNLVDNALRYGRHVAIGARRNGEAVEISVDDDGPGVPPERREDVFRPFFRLAPARDPRGGGVGLGLAVARDIVHGHGGDIALSEAPQGGLRVLVRLPV